jgi:hypothetical protein
MADSSYKINALEASAIIRDVINCLTACFSIDYAFWLHLLARRVCVCVCVVFTGNSPEMTHRVRMLKMSATAGAVNYMTRFCDPFCVSLFSRLSNEVLTNMSNSSSQIFGL